MSSTAPPVVPSTVQEGIAALVERCKSQMYSFEVISHGLSAGDRASDASLISRSDSDKLLAVLSKLCETKSVSELMQLLAQTASSLSSNATNLAVAFTSNPTLTEVVPLSDRIHAASSNVCNIACAVKIHPDCSKFLWKFVRLQVKYTLQALLQFVERFNDVQAHGKNLVATGSLWDTCDEYATLPKTSAEAFARDIASAASLVKDAATELQESMSSEGGTGGFDDDDDGDGLDQPWTPEEAARGKQVLGAIKDVQKALQQLKSKAVSDKCFDAVQLISSVVDDLAASTYPPQDSAAIELHLAALQKLRATI